MFVFGRVATLEECADRERACGASAEEIEDLARALEAAHARGYRIGEVFRATSPDGSFESTHLSNILHRITPAEMEVARIFRFDADAMRRAGTLRMHPSRTRLLIARPG